jgi:RNA-directed DNA polymerase
MMGMSAKSRWKNNTRTCWVLKCDIKKFFANIHHKTLFTILEQYILDEDIVWLLKNIIGSFESAKGTEVGLPLGNLTSQLFANIYMNEFDQWVKHKLKARYYIRYADDFVFLSEDKERLTGFVSKVGNFLKEQLKLSLHPEKIILKTVHSGIDFLGWVHFSDYRVLRKTTCRRMFKRIKERPVDATLNSYLGLLKHGNTKKNRERVKANCWLFEE